MVLSLHGAPFNAHARTHTTHTHAHTSYKYNDAAKIMSLRMRLLASSKRAASRVSPTPSSASFSWRSSSSSLRTARTKEPSKISVIFDSSANRAPRTQAVTGSIMSGRNDATYSS
uniref:Uncharacterized protein n=1 Tax=Dunaliella tertiolecta TaxID=3047 RepID=A0A7S3QMC5_DUNTE